MESKKLEEKTCKNCNTQILTFADEVYCNECIQNVCSMSNEEYFCRPIDWYSRKCNVTFNCVNVNGKCLCLNHFKLAQDFCYVCTMKRPENDTNFHDNFMWYCENHKPKYCKSKITAWLSLMSNSIPVDVIDNIISKVPHFQSVRFHPDFKISLK